MTRDMSEPKLSGVALLLADISGYTRFMRQPRMSLLHAQALIDRLTSALVEIIKDPLALSKIEGDATIFYAMPDGETSRRAIVDAVPALLTAFASQQGEIQAAKICRCGACEAVDELRIKFIAHAGEAVVSGRGGSMDFAGPSVILAYRLLKNSISANEYFLMTEPFFEVLTEEERERLDRRVEQVEGFEPIEIAYGRLDREPLAAAGRRPATKEKLSHVARIHTRGLAHWIRRDREKYSNLPT